MPRCDANGVSLYYELAGTDAGAGTGTADRLLFISGTGGDLRDQPRLTDGPLADTFQLLMYDQRGLGQSSVPSEPSTMADFADDAAALLDVVGWDDCLVLGVSFGGMVAQELALRHPHRVRRLVLACTSSGGAGGASYPLHELAELDPDTRVARRMELLDTRWDEHWRATHPEMVALIAGRLHVGRQQTEAATAGLTNQLAARAQHDTTAQLGAIACPTFVCGGRFDALAPTANSRYLAAAIPGARLAMFDGGHLFLGQDSTAMPAVIEFLGADAHSAAAP